MGNSKVIVVDGANVAYAERSSKESEPKVSNLVAMRSELQKKGYDPVIIIDASLIHEIDDPDQLDGLLKDPTYRQAPASTDADYFVLKTAESHNARIVSNDQFEDYRKEYPWIDKRRIPFMIVQGEVQLYEPKL